MLIELTSSYPSVHGYICLPGQKGDLGQKGEPGTVGFTGTKGARGLKGLLRSQS